MNAVFLNFTPESDFTSVLHPYSTGRARDWAFVKTDNIHK
jgi:hypothetical protein